MMSVLIWQNLTIYTFSKEMPIWKANNEMEDDIMLVYCGDNRFMEGEVGT